MQHDHEITPAAAEPLEKVLYITDWDVHYEVNKDGRPWAPGQKKRSGPLEFIRWFVFGPAGDNMAYIEVADLVAVKYGEDAWMVAWGLFGKLLEVAGRQESRLRGYLLGRRGSPISARMLQTVTRFSKDQIDKGLEILTDPEIAWLQWRDAAELEGLGEVGETRRDPHLLLEPKPNRNRTQLEHQDETEAQDQRQPPPVGGPVGSTASGTASGKIFDLDSVSIDHGKLMLILKKLLWPPGATQAQHNGDYTCLLKIVRAVGDGAIGGATAAMARCTAKARELSPLAGNRMAMFVAWFNDQLPADITLGDLPGPGKRGRG